MTTSFNPRVAAFIDQSSPACFKHLSNSRCSIAIAATGRCSRTRSATHHHAKRPSLTASKQRDTSPPAPSAAEIRRSSPVYDGTHSSCAKPSEATKKMQCPVVYLPDNAGWCQSDAGMDSRTVIIRAVVWLRQKS